ncbi:MAG TPA: HEAT repeat domain-containing protein [Actinocrinis sp.]|nr:HEAT repeat domain-containing protein [Actinocrinis sp.]
MLDYFHTDDGAALGLSLLGDAVERKDATEVSLALTVCGRFGYDEQIMPLLIELEPADWHYVHETIVSLLGKLKSPKAVDALYHATQWVPEHLDYDESRALASKAIWALGGTPGPEATEALTRLLDDRDEMLHEWAAAQLSKRSEGPSS